MVPSLMVCDQWGARLMPEDMCYAKVFHDRSTGEFFVPLGSGPPYTRWRQVHIRADSNVSDTFSSFDEGDVREDLNDRIFAGVPWGTHTIVRKGANPSLALVNEFKSSYRGVGCLLLVVALPTALLLVAAAVTTVHSTN